MDKTDKAVADVIDKLQQGFAAVPWHDASALALNALWLQAIIGSVLQILFIIGWFAFTVFLVKWIFKITAPWRDGDDKGLARFMGTMVPCGVLFVATINILFLAGLALRVMGKVLN